jgi:uncharacterized protein (DUF433 family)
MAKYKPKEAGAYTSTEAAHYLRVPISTLRAWAFGQEYKTSKGSSKFFHPVIHVADLKDKLLSFNNLVEIHVLSGIRKTHEIHLPKIRKGLNYVEKKLGTDRPLLTENFLTDGLDLFVEHSGLLLNVTQEGQFEIRESVDKFLQRIERDPSGVPIKLYPFSRHAGVEDDRKVVIDPNVAFGRPVLVGTSVPTANVFERFLAGEPIEELSQDFKVDKSLIEEAIRCEQIKASA